VLAVDASHAAATIMITMATAVMANGWGFTGSPSDTSRAQVGGRGDRR